MSDVITYQLFIDGAWVASDGNEEIEVVNPATETVIGRVPQATRSDVARAVQAARTAFDSGPWPRMSVKERSDIMIRMADIMDRRFDEIVDLNIREAGSTRAVASTTQVRIPIDHFRDMAERVMVRFPWEEGMEPQIAPGYGVGQGVVVREPIGVTALISAYNFPFLLNVIKLSTALAAGCTAIIKPAPTTPLEAFLLGEIAEEAGLPAGVLNIVTGDIDAGQELTTNPMVDMVSFTGSDTVGRLVYAQAAPTMKKVVLELGGKSANIICEDADLDRALVDVLAGFTFHSGQGCALLTRTLVHRSRHDELVGLVKAAVDRIKVGDPADPETGMGPLISAAQRAKVEALIRVGQQEGAQIAFGGGRPVGLDNGYYVEPTLFVNVNNSMEIAQREFFGPVGVMIPFDDDEEAVRLANESDFGLGGSVWAKDSSRAYALARQLRTGYVSINGGGVGLSPYAAFGGYKQSGLGREWGSYGLAEFLQYKSINWSAASG